jgi:predicted nucleic acid-binding protein
MDKVFVDTDICIDLLSKRQPFNKAAELLFSLADTGKIKLCVSSLSFSNIDYVLLSQYSSTHSRQIIAKFKTLVQVLATLEHNLTIIITRNLKDYKNASIIVLTPESYLTKNLI